ncbi:MAG: UDP-N-acetylmuramate--L-alanine ligase [Candidatus Uhrbacteria bacterium]|nr:UDP-N-acetylmuramate--L-alanine ligase [Candidatus Uhrbacteria bacterium]
MKLPYTRVHCIGIGGIHVGAVAKLLAANGAILSGSDAVNHELVRELRDRGFSITVGHRAENVPEDTEVVVYTHAVPEDNPEFVEAKRRGILCIDTHAFLAKLFEGKDQVVVTGTHGKSTTSTMVGMALMAAGVNPTVVVGTKSSVFPDGNFHLGSDDLLVVEGDEYRRHVLSYQPTILVLNNIEFDHPDAFKDVDDYHTMFEEAFHQIRDKGLLIVNADDETCMALVKRHEGEMHERGIHIVRVGKNIGDIQFGEVEVEHDGQVANVTASKSEPAQLRIQLPGEMNMRNAVMALTATIARVEDDGAEEKVLRAFAEFPGCWRRFERVGLLEGAPVISDYGHHPTEISETLKAAKVTFPDRRIVLCYQPHHRNRTRGLFQEFIPAFDLADVLILSEIYDVPGREAAEDADVSSSQLADAVRERDAQAGRSRTIVFAEDLPKTESAIRSIVGPQDLLLMMGAGTIDGLARKIAEKK